jgi:hypothetical protein
LLPAQGHINVQVLNEVAAVVIRKCELSLGEVREFPAGMSCVRVGHNPTRNFGIGITMECVVASVRRQVLCLRDGSRIPSAVDLSGSDVPRAPCEQFEIP